MRSRVWVVFIPAIIFSTGGTKTIEALLGQHNKNKSDSHFVLLDSVVCFRSNNVSPFYFFRGNVINVISFFNISGNYVFLNIFVHYRSCVRGLL